MEIIFGHLLNVLFTLNLHLATTLKVSVFGVIMVSIFPHSNLLRGDTEYSSVWMQENADQKDTEYGHLLRSECPGVIWGT